MLDKLKTMTKLPSKLDIIPLALGKYQFITTQNGGTHAMNVLYFSVALLWTFSLIWDVWHEEIFWLSLNLRRQTIDLYLLWITQFLRKVKIPELIQLQNGGGSKPAKDKKKKHKHLAAWS